MKQMKNKRLNIALLAGGDSSERQISLNSSAMVGSSLDKERYNLFLIDMLGGNWHYKDAEGEEWQVDKNDFSLTVDGEKHLLDYALIMLHGTPGEDGKVQGYLDMVGVSHSACSVSSSVITFDKLACKRAVAEYGIPLARHLYFKRGDEINPEQIAAELGLPMFVKPNASGSSYGVTRVTEVGQIEAAIEYAFEESPLVLAEELIVGREAGCGVLITKEREYVLPVTEIVPNNEFFDYEAKYMGVADEITPGDFEEEVVERMNKMSIDAYRACDCRGLVRVDFIVEEDGTPVMIEVNTVPGMSKESIVPQQIVAAGMTMGEMLDIVIEDTYTERR